LPDKSKKENQKKESKRTKAKERKQKNENKRTKQEMGIKRGAKSAPLTDY